MHKDPEREPNRRSGESGSEPIEWQNDDGEEEGPREGRDVETDTQAKPDGSRHNA